MSPARPSPGTGLQASPSLGFATMLMNLFGVNLFFSGLHSYANAGGMG